VIGRERREMLEENDEGGRNEGRKKGRKEGMKKGRKE
jgi:flagellar biosynthesis/type III secretory pathway protein FliH